MSDEFSPKEEPEKEVLLRDYDKTVEVFKLLADIRFKLTHRMLHV
jgi:hypothetical protein